MKSFFLAFFLLAAFGLAADAQPVPRVKGRIVDFDGLTFHLAPEGGGAVLAVRLQSGTVFNTTEKRSLSSFKVGDWAGATFRDSDGAASAEEIYLYPEGLRGSGEGRLSRDNGRFVVNGTVTAVDGHSITLFYRGAKKVDGICLDRPDLSRPSPACTADPKISVPDGTPVLALIAGDRRLLVPGAIATVSIAADEKGLRTTPGMILEKPQTAP
jgi:hypothetical protein